MDYWLNLICRYWPHLAAGFDFLAALLASVHALLHKRDSRAATLWLGLIWFLPAFGPILYLILGVNRIRRRAVSLRVHKTSQGRIPKDLGEPQPDGAEHLKMLAHVVGRVVAQPLTPGNHMQPLVNGDEAFPAMLAAIESATQSISLASYIFDNDASGKQFAAALGRAAKRGVAVRVLIDAAGTRYSWPPITHHLRHSQIPFAKFLPASLLTPWRVATINLRNHRKNSRGGRPDGFHRRHEHPPGQRARQQTQKPVQDLHFRVEGPVVTRLQEAFANDWAFTTGEVLDGEIWFPEPRLSHSGVIARVITDGPDADYDKLRWTLLAALARGANLRANSHAVFSAGPGARHRLEPRGVARCAGGHRFAGQKQSALRPLGVARHVVAGARTRLPYLAHAAAVRSLQTDDCGWTLGSARLGQLGRAQFAAEF
jgi:cardiolipin synthase